MSQRPDPARPRVWQRYVALGDSFTEGLADPHPTTPDRFVGWADRLAVSLAARNAESGVGFGYANLAVRGRLIEDVAGQQTDDALALTPDLVSFSAGGNDLLRPRVSIHGVIDVLEEAVTRIRETGADVLLVTAPDMSWAPIIHRVHPRMVEYTANLWGVAQRHGCFVADIFSLRPLQDARMWADDRIHLTSEGHARVATQAAWTLGVPITGDGWIDPLPPVPPLTRFATMRAHRLWARAYLGPWIQRRLRGESSGDGRVPKRPEVTPVPLPRPPED